METYKLRYNLYNYLIDNDTNYILTSGSINKSKYFIIAIYIFFILIIISDITKISYIVIFFIIITFIFIYFTYILDNKLTKIIENKDFIDYCILFKLFNCIFIDSYNSNNIPIYIKYDLYPSISKTTLTNIKETIISAAAAAAAAANANAGIIAKYYKEISAASPQSPNEPNSVANPTINNGILFDTSYLKNNEKTEIIRILNFPITASISNINFELKYIDNKYYCLIFKTSTIYLKLNTNIIADILVVGGGGAGGLDGGGGGGGGQIIYYTNYNLNSGSYQITIGNGGGGESISSDGSDSIIKNITTSSSITGGGGGAGGIKQNSGNNGRGGGGGGGGHLHENTLSGGIPTEGTHSGSGGKGGYTSGGGGGGYNNNGLDGAANWSAIGGNGGNGLKSSISGIEIGYGGGGGGGSYNGSGGLGTDGGGNGGSGQSSKNGVNGVSNTGGGGGGGGWGGQDAGTPGLGGSGIVIIKILNTNNINFTIPETSNNNTPTSSQNPIIIDKRLEPIIIIKIINRTFIIVFKYDYITDINIKNIYEFLEDNYQNFSYFITKINIINNYFYVIDFETLEKEKNKSKILKNIYNNLKTYFIQIHTTFTESISSDANMINNDKLTTLIKYNNNYLNTFYSTLLEINTNIKYDDNISKDNIYNYSEELINNKSILKFINIYNNDKYKILKKYIFIKINNSNTYIKDNYDTNKTLKINPNKITSNTISDVIIDISEIYSAIKDYFLVDIETINKYVKDDRFHINEYILKIYDELLKHYNNKLDLNNTIENFDILFNDTNSDKKIKETVNNYIYIFNIIIIVFIILMTIILHIIYIELFRFL